MEGSGFALFVIWLVGFLVATYSIKYRAGLSIWHRVDVFGPHGTGLGLLLWMTIKALLWPITMVVWFLSGRPEPQTVFNERAAERERRELA
jgi:hypothetical protein